MGLLSWIILGVIAGLLAERVMQSRLGITDNIFGIVDNITVGTLGALVGGCLATVLLRLDHPLQDFNLFSSIIAFLGAILVIAVIRAFPGRFPI